MDIYASGKFWCCWSLWNYANMTGWLFYVSNYLAGLFNFGADQDCHYGAVECRRKLGAWPTKPKLSSDATLKLVAYQVASSSRKNSRKK